jgi:uncharacterized protein YcbK (DUF882 family)
MFFSHFVCNELLTRRAYQPRRVPQLVRLRRKCQFGCSSAVRRLRGFSSVKSSFFGVPGAMLAGMVCVCVAFLMSGATPSSAEERTIAMFNIHTHENIRVTFKRNGRYVPEGLQQLNRFMRDWRRDMQIRMDPGLIDLIWELHEELGSKEPVHLICGYRSAGTNEMLRRTSGGQARQSRHITGQAADLMFPDVPLKQLRYSALVHERGGVGFYPRSGIPFVHVDTGNVRHWPRVSRTELAVLFPRGYSQHVPEDGRPLTPGDSRIALARWRANGSELPWAISRKRAQGPMLASLVPAETNLLQRASLTVQDEMAKPKAQTPEAPQAQKPEALPKPESLARETPQEQPEPQLAEEGEEVEDDIAFEPLPATFLLAEKPMSYSDVADDQDRAAVFPKIGLLMASPSALASAEFDHRLQIEELYEANTFKGAAIALLKQHAARTAVASADARSTR